MPVLAYRNVKGLFNQRFYVSHENSHVQQMKAMSVMTLSRLFDDLKVHFEELEFYYLEVDVVDLGDLALLHQCLLGLTHLKTIRMNNTRSITDWNEADSLDSVASCVARLPAMDQFELHVGCYELDGCMVPKTVVAVAQSKSLKSLLLDRITLSLGSTVQLASSLEAHRHSDDTRRELRLRNLSIHHTYLSKESLLKFLRMLKRNRSIQTFSLRGCKARTKIYNMNDEMAQVFAEACRSNSKLKFLGFTQSIPLTRRANIWLLNMLQRNHTLEKFLIEYLYVGDDNRLHSKISEFVALNKYALRPFVGARAELVNAYPFRAALANALSVHPSNSNAADQGSSCFACYPTT